MSVLYAESSAVLSWLLSAPQGPAIEKILADAPAVVSSIITSAEVRRVLRRLEATGAVSGEAARRSWIDYSAAAAHWDLHSVSDDVLLRVGEPFPVEPLRTLDAIHLATVVSYATQVRALTVLSLDERVCQNARALGMKLAAIPGT